MLQKEKTGKKMDKWRYMNERRYMNGLWPHGWLFPENTHCKSDCKLPS